MPDIKIPIKQFGFAGKYSEALYVAATKANAADKVHQELVKVTDMVNNHEDVQNFFKDPTVRAEEKEVTVLKIMDGMKVSPVTKNFMGVLAQNGRLKDLFKIYALFEAQMTASKGEVNCVVTTAEPLDAASLDSAKKKAMSMVPKGSKISLTAEVDPSIRGGWTLAIGDSFLDFSEKSRLKDMEEVIRQTINRYESGERVAK